MLSLASELIGRYVQARDGEVGRIDDLYFDDERWGVRYVVVATGGWLASKQVLLSPASIARDGELSDPVRVDLSREQIENSPDVDTDKPVSRYYEAAHALHYGYPVYWRGPFPLGRACLSRGHSAGGSGGRPAAGGRGVGAHRGGKGGAVACA